ncbi:MAG: hypothetical protein ACEPO8_01430 [Rhodothermaceae bacterium]
MKGTFITLFCFIVLIFTACDSGTGLSDDINGEIAIQLEKNPASSAGTSSPYTPFILQEDIVSYDWETHTLTLTLEGILKFSSKPITDRKKFFVTIGDKEMYSGEFYNPAMSYIIKAPVISILGNTGLSKRQFRIDKGYPPHLAEKDQRNNMQLYNALKARNLLQ